MTGTLAAATAIGHYRYGSCFVDRTTGLRFEAHHPATRPDLWQAYLEGAVREYEKYGLSQLIDRDELTRAEGVSMFFVALDAEGQVTAGMRCYGPLDDVDDSVALPEMASSPEAPELREIIRSKVPYGVVEIKGVWRAASGDGSHLVAASLGRCTIHSLEWLGAEMALGAVAERLQPYAAALGGRMVGTKSAAFPTEQYRTVLLAYYRSDYRPLIRPDQAALFREESEQLRAAPPPGSDSGWRPVILDTRRRADRHILARLRADPGIELVDVARRQRRELQQLLPAPDVDQLEETDRYVYYPWRRTVVRMVGPQAFPVIRLDRNRNRITRMEQDRLRTQRIGIVGLSAGHSIAATLALEGLCGELRLADSDEVELTNLNRLPASVLDVGLNKAVLGARRVAEIDPYLSVQVLPEGISRENIEEFVSGLDVLVDECDSIDMKLLLREVARRHRVPVVMESSDRGMLDVERFDREPDRPILHNLLPGVSASKLASLPLLQKIPYVIDIVDPNQGSARGAASLAEIGRTLSTWPQLAADVTLGGATVAAVVRRLGLGEPLPSGRVRIDLDAIVGTLSAPAQPDTATWADPPPAPVKPDTEDPLIVIAHAASLAPSGGNAQPWHLTAETGTLCIELDRGRASTMDVRSRGSYVGIGAALFNARVAAAALGKLGAVSLFPGEPHADVVASLTLEDGTDPELADLYPEVLVRRTNRRRGAPELLDLSLPGSLAKAAVAEGGRLHLVTDEQQLATCAEILGASERIRFLTATLHREMISELRWPGDDLHTGIDVRTLELEPAEVATLKLARRGDVMELLAEWDLGQALGDHARAAVRSSSALAVVTVPSASPGSYVRGGAAVERVWVEAQEAGLGVHPMSPVFVFAVQEADYLTLGGGRWAKELHALSQRFRDALDLAPTEVMALVLRLSHVPPPTVVSQRRPLDQILLTHGHTTPAS
jgi:molybdopterin/thiamine biosynthesis adenylyltransferase